MKKARPPPTKNQQRDVKRRTGYTLTETAAYRPSLSILCADNIRSSYSAPLVWVSSRQRVCSGAEGCVRMRVARCKKKNGAGRRRVRGGGRGRLEISRCTGRIGDHDTRACASLSLPPARRRGAMPCRTPMFVSLSLLSVLVGKAFGAETGYVFGDENCRNRL